MKTVCIQYTDINAPEGAPMSVLTATPLEERREQLNSKEWCQRFRIGGRVVWVGIQQGKRVRIAFKPRGQNIGHKWSGYVRDDTAGELWSGDVGQTLGARGLLARALSVGALDRYLPESLRGVGASKS